MAKHEVTPEQKAKLDAIFEKARAAEKVIENYSQERVDKMVRAVAWAAGNPKTFQEICWMGVDEAGAGDRDGR